MDIGGRKAFILAPGCDLAMATTSENILAVSNLVRDVELQAEIRASEAPVNEVEKLDLTSHWEEDKVVIDIITLDSSSCAPCQYMVNAVARASEKFGDKVIYTEHRIKKK
jgi:thiol-disulfide isomerase/thioredoxin